jgi:single-stranded DNA-binding protein
MNNIVIISGFLGNDPKGIATKSGGEMASFSIGNSVYQGKGKDSHTNWVNVSAFKATGEYVLKNAHKGDLVLVEGQLYVRKDADNKVWTSITAKSVEILKRKSDTPKTQDQSAESWPDGEMVF